MLPVSWRRAVFHAFDNYGVRRKAAAKTNAPFNGLYSSIATCDKCLSWGVSPDEMVTLEMTMIGLSSSSTSANGTLGDDWDIRRKYERLGQCYLCGSSK